MIQGKIDSMNQLKISTTLALISFTLAAAPAAGVAMEYVPLSSREQLRSIELEAYACSRENTTEACKLTREIADPLMDHPTAPSACKDAIWELLQSAKTAPKNTFQRRDSIDRPARRITVVCAKPVKPKTQPPMKKSAPSQT